MAANNYELSSRAGVINPYTFVPVDTKAVSRRNSEEYYRQEELHTGVLRCSVLVKTPLAVPDTEAVEMDGDHGSYPFYRIGDCYAIPGSTLRGAIRSVYETITNSCFSTLRDDTFLSLREEANNPYKPGILKYENGKYVLYEAKRYLVPIRNYKGKSSSGFEVCIRDGVRKLRSENTFLKTGDKVRFSFKKAGGNREIVTGINGAGGIKEGFLYLGEPLSSKKHNESIFEKMQRENMCSSAMLERAYQRLLATLDIYQNKSINKNLAKDHNGYAGAEMVDPEKGVPLWYSIEKGKIHFSYAAIGRTMYERTLNDLAGEADRCRDRRAVCEACLLFGMAGGSRDGQQGLGSRIRITDAFAEGTPMTNKEVLKELGTPRYSYLPFYAKGEVESAPSSYDEENVAIAGRKYYWHNKNLMKEGEEKTYSAGASSEANKRNATMELVEPGAVFTFEIYYDEISDSQLQKLLWALTLGDQRDTDRCYKLGHGKPLGLGSVKILVEERWERKADMNGYVLYPESTEPQNVDFNCDPILCAVEKVLSIEQPLQGKNAGYKIDYPNIVDQNDREIPISIQQNNNKKARHQWYSQNKSPKQKMQQLPDIMADSQVLMAYRFVEKPVRTGGGPRPKGKKPSSSFFFIQGKDYQAEVFGYNPKKTNVYILVEGMQGSLYYRNIPGAKEGEVDKILSKGQKIVVQYMNTKEKDGKTFYNFKMKE